MTHDEARSILELTGQPTALEVRRAYARAVKAHKPDVDPTGFAKVREAFELLSATASRVVARTEEEVERESEREQGTERKPDDEHGASDETNETRDDAPRVDAAARVDKLHACFRREAYEEGLALAYQAIEAHSAHSVFYEAALHALTKLERKEELVAMLRRAIDAGQTHLLGSLAQLAPDGVRESELLTGAAHRDAKLSAALAEIALRRGQFEIAMAATVAAMEHTKTPEEAPLRLCVRFMALASEAGAKSAVGRVQQVFMDYLTSAGGERELLTSHGILGMWASLRELWVVHAALPNYPRYALYRAIADGDISRARPDFWLLTKDFAAADETWKALLRAPAIAEVFRDLLVQPVRKAVTPGRVKLQTLGLLAFIATAFLGVWYLLDTSSTSPKSGPKHPIMNPAATLPTAETPVKRRKIVSRNVAVLVRELSDPEDREDAVDLVWAFDGSCSESNYALTKLERSLPKDNADARAAFDQLRELQRQGCGS